MVANMLSSPLAAAGHQAYIAFDLEPSRVDASRQAGFLVQYGDGSRSDVLKAAGEREMGSLSVWGVCLGGGVACGVLLPEGRQVMPECDSAGRRVLGGGGPIRN
jgi:hypothetical protein